jgi:hypothetical protein
MFGCPVTMHGHPVGEGQKRGLSPVLHASTRWPPINPDNVGETRDRVYLQGFRIAHRGRVIGIARGGEAMVALGR